MHPRNRHTGRYDFEALIQSSPALSRFVSQNSYGDLSIDFADPNAVKALNAALLSNFYGIVDWKIPAGYLCPPVPGRADYIHNIADLLSGDSRHDGKIPRGESIRVLDIGVGANCIYPIIGNREYGWSFVGSDIDPVALASAKEIVGANPELKKAITFRLQKSPVSIFTNLLEGTETFDVSICNPPFHASAEEARAGSRRKWNNLGLAKNTKPDPRLNFGGNELELWCPGGEVAFVKRMLEESVKIPTRIKWFTSLVSREEHLEPLYRSLEKAGVADYKMIELFQGQKKSRIVAWTFSDEA
jgi:23S rRNA (adenine1618-N6)-methyltransferase